jgi:predicted dehydrogenase
MGDLIVPRVDATATHVIQAVGSSSLEKGRAFVQKYGGDITPSISGSYDAVYADPEVDIVYIGISHAFHKDACLKAMSHGKHALCEKPFTLNTQEAQEVFNAARKMGVFVMERDNISSSFLYLVSRNANEVRSLSDVNSIHATDGPTSTNDPWRKVNRGCASGLL